MQMTPGDIFLVFWLIISILIAVWVYVDLPHRSPVLRLMKPAWILICIYAGLFGLLIYELTCKSSKPLIPSSPRFAASSYRKASASSVHCATGAATGIIIAAIISTILQLPSAVEYLLEYILSFVFAILVFHGLYYASVYSTYKQAIRETIWAEFISLNFTLAAMMPVMSLCFTLVPNANHPTLVRFWFVIQLATICGYLAGYPMIYWMVEHKLKRNIMYPPTKPHSYPTPKTSTPTPSNAEAFQTTSQASQDKKRLMIVGLLSIFLLAAGYTIAVYLTPILPSLDLGGAFLQKDQ